VRGVRGSVPTCEAACRSYKDHSAGSQTASQASPCLVRGRRDACSKIRRGNTGWVGRRAGSFPAMAPASYPFADHGPNATPHLSTSVVTPLKVPARDRRGAGASTKPIGAATAPATKPQQNGLPSLSLTLLSVAHLVY
jgi:hypothetical protein